MLSADDVRRLARLARLDLDEEEVRLFARQLGDILDFARQVQAVDTTGAPAPADAVPATPLRPDAVRPSLPKDDVIGEAPAADPSTGLFTVPRVLGGS